MDRLHANHQNRILQNQCCTYKTIPQIHFVVEKTKLNKTTTKNHKQQKTNQEKQPPMITPCPTKVGFFLFFRGYFLGIYFRINCEILKRNMNFYSSSIDTHSYYTPMGLSQFSFILLSSGLIRHLVHSEAAPTAVPCSSHAVSNQPVRCCICC